MTAWDAVREALDRAAAAGRTVRLWLRDDDAVTATPALDRLAASCDGLPVLLAVIPAGADDALARWVEDHPAATPCQHGVAHANHAAPGERPRELGGSRGLSEILRDLARGRERLQALFGRRLADILVPPWNRIDEAVVPHLADLGFSALSTFGPAAPQADGLRRLNSRLDIIDWRGGRIGRSAADVARRLAALVDEAASTGEPIGLLTHHLAHDATAWAVLDELLDLLRRHPAATFPPATGLIRARHV